MASLTNSNTYARSMNGISSISANQVYTEALSVGQLEITSGITATQSQVINFGSNAPIMQGTNITNISGLALPSTLAYKNQSNTFTLAQIFSTGGTGDAIKVIKTGTNGYIFLHNDGAIGYWSGTSIIWNINSTGLIQSTGGLSITGGSVSFTNPPTMSGANISNASIPDNALTLNIPRLNGNNVYYGINQYSPASALNSIRVDRYNVANAFTFLRSDGITGYTPDGDVANTNWSFTPAGLLTTKGGITASHSQTINFGRNAPTMSGANISAGSIPDTALSSSNLAKLDLNNTFTGLNTFTQPPIMSGAFISSGSIGDASIANAENYAKTNGGNTFQYQYTNNFDGTNTYSKLNTFTSIITSMTKSATNPVITTSLNNYTYYFYDNTTTSATFKWTNSKVVYYVVVGGGGGGAGNMQYNVIGLGGGGGEAGKVSSGSFTAGGGITYTISVGAGGIGSAGIYTGNDPGISNNGGNGGTSSISATGFLISADGGQGGYGGGPFYGGDGGGVGKGYGAQPPPSPTGSYYGTNGTSGGGGGGGNAGGGTATTGHTRVLTTTSTDNVTYNFTGGGGGGDLTSGQNATSYGGGGQGGGCNTGSNQTATQNGGNGYKGFILLYVLSSDLLNVSFDCKAVALTPLPGNNSTELATTAYVKSQYAYDNTFTNMVYLSPLSTIVGTATTGANGALQIICSSGATSVARDGIGIKASFDTNNIINFTNTSGTLRGAIVGSSSTAVAYNTTSDERLKENIVSMPSQLDNIKLLSARSYNWKSTGEKDNGFIAQEIYKIYPELNPLKNNDKYYDKLYPVKSDGTEYIHTIDYGRMTPYLWSAVQELTLIVEKQQQQISNLINQINDFSTRI